MREKKSESERREGIGVGEEETGKGILTSDKQHGSLLPVGADTPRKKRRGARKRERQREQARECE